MKNNLKTKKWGWLLLFTSLPTLICCVLPIILVNLGMGSIVANLYSNKFPWLQWFGVNSALSFGASGVILLISAYVLFNPKRTCPSDPKLAQACNIVQKWNMRFFYLSITVWILSAFSSFVLPLIAL